VKPASFAYHRPRSRDEAAALLDVHGDDAAILAGGQSLVPMLNLRLATPELVIDINRVAGFDRLTETADGLEIGPCVRHADVLRHTAGAPHWRLIAEAIRHVAHPGIRNRGTVCGSLALADPAAEAPAVAVAMDAEITLAGTSGERRIPAADFFTGIYETARRPDELITGVRFPKPAADWHFVFEEVARRQGDYAMAGLCAAFRVEDGSVLESRLVLFGVADRPHRATAAESFLTGRPLADGTARRNAVAAAEGIEAMAAADCSADYKRHLAGVLVTRAMSALARQAAAP
jgi:carbon-monoxide dehydrogenase medium subunit